MIKPTRTLQEAVEQGYVVMRDRYAICSLFFRNCEKTDAPYVRIRLKTTFAVVEVDLIGQSYRMSEHACSEIHDLLKEHHVGRWGWRMCSHNHTIMYSPRIRLEDADKVAKEIVSILAKPGYREPDRLPVSPLVNELDNALRTGALDKAPASHRHSKGQRWLANST